MDNYEVVKQELDNLQIPYELVNHEPALTMEQADSFIKSVEGVRTKTMFLTNKKKTAYYMLIMDNQKRMDMSAIAEKLNAKRIKLASANSLKEKTNLPPGVVSPFGLLNNVDKDINIFLDDEIMSKERMSFHPNTNDKTIFIKTSDLVKFIKSLGYQVNIIRF